MTTLPKDLEKLLDELARENFNDGGFTNSLSAIKSRDRDIFSQGFNALYQHLTEASGEFDVHAALLKIANTPPDEWTDSEVDKFMIGARWMFDQMSARVGLAEKTLYDVKVALDHEKFSHQNAFEKWQNSMKREEQLEARLEESELAYLRTLRTRDAEINRLNGRLGEFRDKLAAAETRIKELEAALILSKLMFDLIGMKL